MSSRRRVRRRKRSAGPILFAVAVLIAGLGVIGWEIRSKGLPASQPRAASDPAPAASPSAATGEPLDEEESPSLAPAAPRTRFADGIWTVGKDVKAGRYKTTVPTDVFSCHWERMRDAVGTTQSTIEEGLSRPGTKVTVTIRPGDKLFKSELCGTWSPA
jgi:hypothetical protein